jgi:hypothetical protein
MFAMFFLVDFSNFFISSGFKAELSIWFPLSKFPSSLEDDSEAAYFSAVLRWLLPPPIPLRLIALILTSLRK